MKAKILNTLLALLCQATGPSAARWTATPSPASSLGGNGNPVTLTKE